MDSEFMHTIADLGVLKAKSLDVGMVSQRVWFVGRAHSFLAAVSSDDTT